MLGGTNSESDAMPAVHHLDDAGNYIKICNLSYFKQCLTVYLMTYWSIIILHMVLRRRFLVPPHWVIQ
jgi:hypothetical protein